MSVYCTCLSLLLAQLCMLGAALSAVKSDDQEFRSDYTFSQKVDGWFKVHRESVEWETARIQCYNEGAVLASPVDPYLAIALRKLLIQADLDNTVFFSGVSSPLGDGVYTSIEGIALDQLIKYAPWDIGQPNNLDGHQHCITFIHYKYSDELNINDEFCNNKFPFICYRPKDSNGYYDIGLREYRTVNKDKLRDNELCCDYTFSHDAAGWLKLHREKVNWQTAHLQCQHEGAVLASPLNAYVATALMKLVTKAEFENSTDFFSGVVSRLGDGVFTSIEGVAIDQLYTEWNIGQPNGIRQDCITFSYYKGRDIMPINDEDCYKTFPYICYRSASIFDNMTKYRTMDKEASYGKGFRSDYTFSQEAAGWLKLHRLPQDWYTARFQCYYEGAMLASPLNANLSTALTMLLSRAKLRNYTEFFSGVSFAVNHGVFTQIEGVDLDQIYYEWEIYDTIDRANYYGDNQHCITYFYYEDRNMLPINDENCNKKFPYICYRPASASDKLTECGTVDTEYKLDARTRHCYKFHHHGMKWPSAARVCHAEGGYLAVIDSQPEADLLAELVYKQYSQEPLWYMEKASIGFSMRSGKLWTVQGKPLEETGFFNWRKGKPNNVGGNEQCGGISFDGQLEYVNCDMAYRFICEKSPESLLTMTGNLDRIYF